MVNVSYHHTFFLFLFLISDAASIYTGFLIKLTKFTFFPNIKQFRIQDTTKFAGLYKKNSRNVILLGESWMANVILPEIF